MKANKPTIDVNGLSIKDIIDMPLDDIQKFNDRQIRAITNRLISARNKRLRRWVKQPVKGDAVRSLAEQMGISKKELERGKVPQFSIKNLKGKGSTGKVQGEFSAVRDFLQKKTSSQRKTEVSQGFAETKNKIKKLLGNKITSSKEKQNAFWNAYHKFMDEYHQNEIYKSKDGQNQVISWLREYAENNKGFTEDSLFDALQNELNSMTDTDSKFKNKYYNDNDYDISFDESEL